MPIVVARVRGGGDRFLLYNICSVSPCDNPLFRLQEIPVSSVRAIRSRWGPQDSVYGILVSLSRNRSHRVQLSGVRVRGFLR